jgi:integrase
VTAQAPSLTLTQAAAIVRQALRDKSWEDTSLGGDVAAYLQAKRKRLTSDSYKAYESALDKLCWHFLGVNLASLEPPVGNERLEEFMDRQWGQDAPRTFNKNLSIVGDFFKWCCRHGRMIGDPTLNIDRAKARGVYRTTFTADQRRSIIAQQESRRDRLALRLLLDYGLRKGALRAVQIKHFDHQRKRLTIFTKGQKVREVPIPHPEFWLDVERHILDTNAESSHYLLCGRSRAKTGFPGSERPWLPMSSSAAHKWWYGCLNAAGIVPAGVESGERMHKARHTAGQRVLDATGNLKAVQKLLGHSSIQTTGDVYADWDIEALTASMVRVLEEES